MLGKYYHNPFLLSINIHCLTVYDDCVTIKAQSLVGLGLRELFAKIRKAEYSPYASKSRVTGQWSLPMISERMAASVRDFFSLSETRK